MDMKIGFKNISFFICTEMRKAIGTLNFAGMFAALSYLQCMKSWHCIPRKSIECMTF